MKKVRFKARKIAAYALSITLVACAGFGQVLEVSADTVSEGDVIEKNRLYDICQGILDNDIVSLNGLVDTAVKKSEAAQGGTDKAVLNGETKLATVTNTGITGTGKQLTKATNAANSAATYESKALTAYNTIKNATDASYTYEKTLASAHSNAASAKTQEEMAKAAYEAALDAYNSAVAAYESALDTWNANVENAKASATERIQSAQNKANEISLALADAYGKYSSDASSEAIEKYNTAVSKVNEAKGILGKITFNSINTSAALDNLAAALKNVEAANVKYNAAKTSAANAKQYAESADAAFLGRKIPAEFYVIKRGLIQPEEIKQHGKENYSSVKASGTLLSGVWDEENQVVIPFLTTYKNGTIDNVYDYLVDVPTAEELGVELNEGEYIRWYVIKTSGGVLHVDGIIEGQKYEVTIKYICYNEDDSYDEIAPAITTEAILGQRFEYELKNIDGYVCKTDVNFIQVYDKETTIYVEYEKENEVDITINYVDKETGDIINIVSDKVYESKAPGYADKLSQSELDAFRPDGYEKGVLVSYGFNEEAGKWIATVEYTESEAKVIINYSNKKTGELLGKKDLTLKLSKVAGFADTLTAEDIDEYRPGGYKAGVIDSYGYDQEQEAWVLNISYSKKKSKTVEETDVTPNPDPKPNPQPTPQPTPDTVEVEPIIPNPDITPVVPNVSVTPVPVEPTVDTEEVVEESGDIVNIEDDEIPMADSADIQADSDEIVVIEEEEIPLASPAHCFIHWLIALIALLFVVFELISCKKKNDKINELKDSSRRVEV